MFRRFLLKNDFWAQPRRDGQKPTCYVKHSVKVGGIYAFLQPKGVKLRVDDDERYFNNFDDLEGYLERLNLNAKDTSNEFMHIINRRTTTKALRQIPL